MASEYLSCPFCGFEFEREDTLCHHGCPLGPICRLIRCPNCQYEHAEQPESAGWWQRWLFRRRATEAEPHARVITVPELEVGEQVTVLCVGGDRAAQKNALAVYGIVPGAEVTLLQRIPSFVLAVGQTELALDPGIAREILVQRRESLEAQG